MRMRIVEDDLRGLEIAALLQFHLDEMHRNSPPGSVYALDLDALRHPTITFFTAWEGNDLMGCGAIKMLDERHAEIKSMRTHPDFVRRGVAAAILQHIIATATERGCDTLSLETGSGEAFDAAIALYARFGFKPCGAFGDYVHSPFNQFFSLQITSPRG